MMSKYCIFSVEIIILVDLALDLVLNCLDSVKLSRRSVSISMHASLIPLYNVNNKFIYMAYGLNNTVIIRVNQTKKI